MSKEVSENVIIAKDGTETISTDVFPYATFMHDCFNPVQSAILPHTMQDVNMVVCTSTASGKTIVAEMCMSYDWFENEKTSLYIAPMRALAIEKIDDWTDPNHHFAELDMAICTGDFQITPKRIEELNNAHIVILTPEMLAVRCRNIASEKSQFIHNAGTIVLDEAHILTVPDRGDAVEVLLMDVAKHNPTARFVLLSATISNAKEIAKWLTTLNGKKTVVLESTFRPVQLKWSYPVYCDYGGPAKYKQTEVNKTSEAIKIIKAFPHDKFLVFYHTKASGYSAVKRLQDAGIDAVFFNADQTLENKTEFLRRFQDQKDRSLRVLCSTSSLAWGNNTCAVHAIIVGPYRGLTPVENYDIFQMAGRAGRPQYSKEAYVHMLLPKSKKEDWLERLQQGNIIDSTFAIGRQRPGENVSDYFNRIDEQESNVENTIAHHLIAQVAGGLDTKEKLTEWFKGTLAYFQQGSKATHKIERVIDALTRAGLTKIVDEDKLVATRLGKVASLMYYPPFDIAGFHKNINRIENKDELEDRDIAFILSNTNTNARGYISKRDEEFLDYNIVKLAGKYEFIKPHIIKPFTAWYLILQGDIDGYFGPYQKTLMNDSERIVAALKMMDGYFSYGFNEQLNVIGLQLKYGIKKELISLVKIPNIGRARAIKLYDAHIRTPDDLIRASADEFKKILGIVSPAVIAQFKEDARLLKT